jgi:exopolysaccharide biosynthesis polyprenyl glycosylphosphotransferase
VVLADLVAVVGAAGLVGRFSAVIAVAWVGLLAGSGGYELRRPRSVESELRRWIVIGCGLVTITVVAGMFLDPVAGREELVLCLVTVATTVVLRAALDVAERATAAATGRTRTLRVFVVGRRPDVLRVVGDLRRAPGHSAHVVGACLPRKADPAGFDVPVRCGFDDVAEAARRQDADAVIVVPGKGMGAARLRQLREDLSHSGTALFVSPALADVIPDRMHLSAIGTAPLLHVRPGHDAPVSRLGKEIWERSAALVALVVALPLLAVLMVMIRRESPGPALFRQVRVGRDGRVFTMYKLRTMIPSADAALAGLRERNEAGGVLFKIRKDPRVTSLGSVLRRYSLDELPQLANVVLGQMALVGPRPALVSEVACYDEATARRLQVKPGLTGLWQVSGRSDLTWPEAVRLDLMYVDNWSLSLDLRIAVRTFRTVVAHQGAY